MYQSNFEYFIIFLIVLRDTQKIRLVEHLQYESLTKKGTL